MSARWAVGGAGDLEQRHLRAERHALGAFQCKQRLGHQQAEHMRLVGYAGQHDARAALAAGQAGDRLAQDALGQFGEQVLLEDLDAAFLPGFADVAGEGGDGVLDKTLQSLAGEPLLHRLLEGGAVVLLDQCQQGVEFIAAAMAGAGGRRRRTSRGQRGKLLGWRGDQLSRAGARHPSGA